jgi:hypothetical protein
MPKTPPANNKLNIKLKLLDEEESAEGVNLEGEELRLGCVWGISWLSWGYEFGNGSHISEKDINNQKMNETGVL